MRMTAYTHILSVIEPIIALQTIGFNSNHTSCLPANGILALGNTLIETVETLLATRFFILLLLTFAKKAIRIKTPLYPDGIGVLFRLQCPSI